MKTEAFVKWEIGKAAMIAVVIDKTISELSIVVEGTAITPTPAFSENTMKSLLREIRNPDAAWKRILTLSVHDAEYAKSFLSGEFFASRVRSLMAQGEFESVYSAMENAAKPRTEKPSTPENGNTETSGKRRGRPRKVIVSESA